MKGLAEKDAVADKMQSITSLQVTAWHCHTCRCASSYVVVLYSCLVVRLPRSAFASWCVCLAVSQYQAIRLPNDHSHRNDHYYPSARRTSERRYPECSEHVLKRVKVTKRWWTCSGCAYHFCTVGVSYPPHACHKCKDAGVRFVRASMYRGGPKDRHAPGENAVASADKLLVRGREQPFVSS